MQIFI